MESAPPTTTVAGGTGKAPELLKLNLGCGTRHEKGFINIDQVAPADRICDITQGLPFEEDSCGEIKAAQLLEHLDCSGLFRVLNECHRVLAPEGVMRIWVPDADRAFARAVAAPTHKRFFVKRSFQYWNVEHRLWRNYGRRYGLLPWRLVVKQEGYYNLYAEQTPAEASEESDNGS